MLVLALDLASTGDAEGDYIYDSEGLLAFAGMVVSLDALARGAPALAALQLVLRLRDFDAGGFNMAILWHALERLGRLSALTICWAVDLDELGVYTGELLAAQLDNVHARLPGVTDLCLAITSVGGFIEALEEDGSWQHQVATRIRRNPLTCGKQCSAPDLSLHFQHARQSSAFRVCLLLVLQQRSRLAQ